LDVSSRAGGWRGHGGRGGCCENIGAWVSVDAGRWLSVGWAMGGGRAELAGGGTIVVAIGGS